jgi:MoaA/NifB/PqqE/SkfB family radical SAM enzyme
MKWIKAIRQIAFGKPMGCSIQVTERCNLKCSMCDYWKAPSRKELSLNDFEEIHDKLKDLNVCVISLSGGEPFLRKDFLDIVEIFRHDFYTFVTTNGTLLSNDVCSNLKSDSCFVSIDSDIPEVHDRIRGFKGAWDKAIEGLLFLKDHYKGVSGIMNVVSNLNFPKGVNGLINLADSLGVSIHFQPYCTLKTGAALGGVSGVSKFLLDKREKHKSVVSSRPYLKRFDAAFNEGVKNCLAGQAFFDIQANGEVTRCPDDRTNFGDVWNFPDFPLEKTSCVNCWYSCRGEIESFYKWKFSKLLSLDRLITTQSKKSVDRKKNLTVTSFS